MKLAIPIVMVQYVKNRIDKRIYFSAEGLDCTPIYLMKTSAIYVKEMRTQINEVTNDWILGYYKSEDDMKAAKKEFDEKIEDFLTELEEYYYNKWKAESLESQIIMPSKKFGKEIKKPAKLFEEKNKEQMGRRDRITRRREA